VEPERLVGEWFDALVFDESVVYAEPRHQSPIQSIRSMTASPIAMIVTTPARIGQSLTTSRPVSDAVFEGADLGFACHQ
jgi:hypothetical protein